jgi:hypothetical protein
VAVVLAGAGLAPAARAGEAPTVHSTAPLQPPRTVQLEELWRVGGDDADLMFGLMVDATCDDAGNVYLMDQQLDTVTVVAPDGTVLRQLFREGEGPGEIRTPQGIACLPDGRIALVQQFPGKLIMVDRENEPAGTLTISGGGADREGFTAIAGCSARCEVFLVAGMFQVPAQSSMTRTSYVASIDVTDGTELRRYRVHDTVLDFTQARLVERDMVAPCYTHALGPEGRVYFARDWREYAIEVVSPDGVLERVISRDFEPLQRSQRERDRVDELFEVQASRLSFPITWEIEPTEQYVSGLHVTTDGTLWVAHNRSTHDLPEGIFTEYDTFDPQGRWRQRVRVACDGDPDYDGLIFLNDDRVLLVKGLVLARLTATGSQGAVFEEDGGEGEMEVVCCRMEG